MAFPFSIFVFSFVGLGVLLGLKVAELQGKTTILKRFSARGDALLVTCKRRALHTSREVHHTQVKPALRKAGEVARERDASTFEWCIKELRQAARLVRGKEPSAPPEASVSVFLKQMLDFKNSRNGNHISKES